MDKHAEIRTNWDTENNDYLLLSEKATKEVCLMLDHSIEIAPVNGPDREKMNFIYEDIMGRFTWTRGSWIKADILTSQFVDAIHSHHGENIT